MPTLKINQGDCLSSISLEHGFFWSTIWFHPQNNELRSERKDPFVLHLHDRLFVPDLTKGEISCGSGAKHTFRRLGVPLMFRIQIRIYGEPVTDTPYKATIDRSVEHEGTTDGDGWIEFPIAPDVKTGELWVGDEADEYREHILLDFGHLDPVKEVTGVQQRLCNIGYTINIDGVIGNETRGAILEFQELNEIESSGQADEKTRELLVEQNGA
jgi:hypothetical protein